jgi:hypothetical protein
MPAILSKILPFIVGRIGKGDVVSAAVRFARFVYLVVTGTIILAWYTGWRNKRVAPGDKTKFPFPGVDKSPESYPVSRDDPDVSGYEASSATSALTGGNPITDATSMGNNAASGNFKGGKIPGGMGNQPVSLMQLARIAQNQFGLHVSEYAPFDRVDPVHAANSLHYQNRAFDASGSVDKMALFAHYVVGFHGRRITELIHNSPKGSFSIKNGQPVTPGFWGITTWNNHKNHVHVGI